MKKLLSMLLAAAMLVSAGAMAFAEGTSEKGTIVYGPTITWSLPRIRAASML